jgi:hypothetical protein
MSIIADAAKFPAPSRMHGNIIQIREAVNEHHAKGWNVEVLERTGHDEQRKTKGPVKRLAQFLFPCEVTHGLASVGQPWCRVRRSYTHSQEDALTLHTALSFKFIGLALSSNH